MPIRGKELLHMAYLVYENYVRLFEVISKAEKLLLAPSGMLGVQRTKGNRAHLIRNHVY
jgi:hypothetical protein